MGKTMSKPTCGWVRARLALAVRADNDCLIGTDRDQGDLDSRDLIAIERHVGVCESCRLHHAELERAMGLLAISAECPPVNQSVPSLWPALEARIRGEGDRASHRVSRRSRTVVGFSNSRGLSKTVLFALAASVIIAVVGTSTIRYRRDMAQATIDGNLAPLVDHVDAVTPDQSESIVATEPEALAANQIDSNSESNPPHAAESSVVGADASAVTKHGVVPHRRLGYDLDLGIPVPPDAGEFKPVY